MFYNIDYTKYSGGLNTEHLKPNNIQKPNLFLFGLFFEPNVFDHSKTELFH